MSRSILIRHEGHTPRERSACGWRDRLISHEDVSLNPAAWAHAVDIDGAALHFHKRSTELYYVLEGAGSVSLDGVDHPVGKGSLVHIPPGVVHGAAGKMRVLVVGIPDIADDDYFLAETADTGGGEGGALLPPANGLNPSGIFPRASASTSRTNRKGPWSGSSGD